MPYITLLERLRQLTSALLEKAEQQDWDAVAPGVEERGKLLEQLELATVPADGTPEASLAREHLSWLVEQNGRLTAACAGELEAVKTEASQLAHTQKTLQAYRHNGSGGPREARFVDTRK